MKTIRSIAAFAALLPGCLGEPMTVESMTEDGSSSSGDGDTTFMTASSTTQSSASSTSVATTEGSGTESGSDGSTGDSTGSSSSSGGSETSVQGLCEFTAQPCREDADCGIPGICYADTQKCFHWCASDDDCPDGLTCFVPGAFGSYCVACSDRNLCAGGSECNTNGDCAEPDHEECDTSGKPCEISEQCVIE